MDDDSTHELRRLQARAYGPDADIADDTAALRRLRELEEQLRPALPEPPATALDVAAQPSAASLPAALLGASNAPSAASTPAMPATAATVPALEAPEAPERPASPSARRWLLLGGVWAASVVAVAVIVAVTTWSSSLVQLRPIWEGIDAQQVAVLQESSRFIVPEIFGDTEHSVRGFEDFYGLTAISGLDGWANPPGSDECLVVLRTADLDADARSLNGPVWSACAAGGFPATVQFRVTSDLPDDLRARFPVGSALKFVLDGPRVGVFWDEDRGSPT